ncbi:hypothetical protein COLO4_34721 [Corchorus olitorius]|uniref:Uncharacterized protein n=1 Tax=Corchorus olitorius TaxID=93759 RepID=A0A1R3GJU9_9ROSI|nr:hypothetical protein COLO4_34721 [Corchorus olitorius]
MASRFKLVFAVSLLLLLLAISLFIFGLDLYVFETLTSNFEYPHFFSASFE